MERETQSSEDQDPGPLQHVDAERVGREGADESPEDSGDETGAAAEPDEDEDG